MDKKQLCVVIPVHRFEMADGEIISLKQCHKVLGGYDVYLLYPEGLNVDNYKAVHPNLLLKPVPASWLNSIEAYNRTKRSKDFYLLFKGYNYMLTYELDAYIFTDNWAQANTFNYDYIGAPWFSGYHAANKDSEITGVGNSGFSMRNVQTCIKVLKKLDNIETIWKWFIKLNGPSYMRLAFLLSLTNSFWNKKCPNNVFSGLVKNDHINEDLFWGHIVPYLMKVKIAPVTDAMKFSFELNPSLLFEKNDRQLPIGCHAWEKYDPQFWDNLIEKNNL